MVLALKSISGLGKLYRSGEASPVDVVDEMLGRIERLDPQLRCFITVTADLAREQARQAERELREGLDRGPLHGIPYGAKDLMFTRGILTTSGTKIFRDFKPDYDATVVTKLREAGAVLIGKCNLHEDALGITSSNPHHGAVHNPWDLERIPGGSSGGSTAALSAGLCSFSLGTDTGGSIRIPASFCNVTGLKPSFGRVSRRGVYPLGYTLDHVGPFAQNVEEAAWVYQAMAGKDPLEDSSIDRAVRLPAFDTIPSLKGRKVGVPENFYFEGLDPEVETVVSRALGELESLGAELVGIRVPDIAEMNEIGRLILLAEATSVHIRNLELHYEDYGEDQRSILDQGRFISAVDYLNAQRRRRQMCEEFRRAAAGVDLIAAPTIPVLPAKIGEDMIECGGALQDVRLATTRNVRALNLTGWPLLSAPCGFSAGGLPIGLQLIGKAFDERTLLEVGHAYQQATDWHRRRPRIAEAEARG